MGDLSFQNNVPDPLLAGKELPAFKFALEKSTGKVLGSSFGKEVTVDASGMNRRTSCDKF
jgi:oxalate decarboxylase